jgi:hypothetical protein
MMPPLARTIGVQKVAAGATDLNAVIPGHPFAFRTDQWAYAIELVTNGIECPKTGNFSVELGLGVLVKEFKRPF